MPSRPKHPCNWPGCPALTLERFCPEHRRAYERRRSQERRRKAGTAAGRGYTGSWQRIQAEVLAADPYCRACGQPATEVHHVVPLKAGGSNDRSNLIPLCHACHMRAEAELRRR